MMKTFLGFGASHSIGRDPGGFFEISNLVTVWNNENDRDDLTNIGTSFVSPDLANRPYVGGCNNILTHAASQVAEALDEPIRLFLVGRSGVAGLASQWLGGSATVYARLLAVLAAAGVTEVDAAFWIKAEADGTNWTSYAADWSDFIDQLEGDGIIDSDTPMILGEGNAYNQEWAEEVRNLAALNANHCVAELRQFLLCSDGTHFAASMSQLAGWQFARQYLEVIA